MFVGVAMRRDLFEKASSRPTIVLSTRRRRGPAAVARAWAAVTTNSESRLNQVWSRWTSIMNQRHRHRCYQPGRHLDPALLRPRPLRPQSLRRSTGYSGREKILQVHARGASLPAKRNFKETAWLTASFSGADPENLINEGHSPPGAASAPSARRSSRTLSTASFMGPERQS